eukprot:4927118-Prymnesium_polylepis.1
MEAAGAHGGWPGVTWARRTLTWGSARVAHGGVPASGISGSRVRASPHMATRNSRLRTSRLLSKSSQSKMSMGSTRSRRIRPSSSRWIASGSDVTSAHFTIADSFRARSVADPSILRRWGGVAGGGVHLAVSTWARVSLGSAQRERAGAEQGDVGAPLFEVGEANLARASPRDAKLVDEPRRELVWP